MGVGTYGVRPAVSFDLDRLPTSLVCELFAGAADFAGWLERCGIAVPECWYYHGWSARRLMALMVWYRDAHGPEGTAQAVSEWWASAWGLAGLRADWKELAAHNGRHGKDVPTPPFDEFVAALQAAAEEPAA